MSNLYIALAPEEVRWWVAINDICPSAPARLRHDVAAAGAMFWTWAQGVTPDGEAPPEDVVADPLMQSWLYHWTWAREQFEWAVKRVDRDLEVSYLFAYPKVDEDGALLLDPDRYEEEGA